MFGGLSCLYIHCNLQIIKMSYYFREAFEICLKSMLILF